jgi:hypothetical protein
VSDVRRSHLDCCCCCVLVLAEVGVDAVVMKRRKRSKVDVDGRLCLCCGSLLLLNGAMIMF